MQHNLAILWEDDDVLVLNKPAGVVVNDADSVSADTLQQQVSDYLADLAWPDDWSAQVPADFDATFGTPEEIWQLRRGMIHRLDKDTSGVIIFAKHPGSLAALLKQFRDRTTQKTYQALVHGVPRISTGLVEAPLARSQGDRQKFAVAIEGRPALTLYSVVRKLKPTQELLDKLGKITKRARTLYEAGFALVSCQPKTGRTHQIRVHMAHIGHPLVGDARYAGKKRGQLDAKWCARQFLHAQELQFTHPRSGEKIVVQAPLPQDLEQVLGVLQEV